MLDVLLVFIITLLAIWWWLSRQQRDLPPSPGLALPIIGHLHLLSKNPLEKLTEWREQVGDLFTLQLGNQRVIFINGYDHIHEVLVKQHHHFLERPGIFFIDVLFKFKGITALGGKEWKEHRAFLQSSLRSLGMGKNMMAERISVEVDCLLEDISNTRGEPMDLQHLIMVCVSNVICGISFGKRFDHNDKSFQEALKTLDFGFRVLGASSVLNFLPWLKYIPGDPFYYNELVILGDRLKKWIWETAAVDTREKHGSDESFTDIVQAFVIEMEKRKESGSPLSTINEANLLSTLFAFFVAGTETTSGTIMYALLYMINFPDIQERLFHEIQEHVGTSRLPTLADKPKLTYLQAFIMETQRFTSLLPQTIDRVATKDVRINGYVIPKGTSVIASLDSVLWAKHVWGDPAHFRPERFLSNGSVNARKEFLPFSLGHRNCIGEGLAVMELYLFLSALIQRFQFQPDNPNQKPSLGAKPGFTRGPLPCRLRAIPRSELQ